MRGLLLEGSLVHDAQQLTTALDRLPRVVLAADDALHEAGAVHGVWPRIRPIPRADSSDFARNPAAGLSAISSV
jgi:hypothetical protein